MEGLSRINVHFGWGQISDSFICIISIESVYHDFLQIEFNVSFDGGAHVHFDGKVVSSAVFTYILTDSASQLIVTTLRDPAIRWHELLRRIRISYCDQSANDFRVDWVISEWQLAYFRQFLSVRPKATTRFRRRPAFNSEFYKFNRGD